MVLTKNTPGTRGWSRLIPIPTDTDTDFSRNTDKYRLMPIKTNYRLNKLVYADELYRYRLSDTDIVSIYTD